MSNAVIEHVCIRCGKPRIVGTQERQEIETHSGTTMVLVTKMVCPDPECQIQVEAELAKQAAKRVALNQAKEQRELDRREASLNHKKLEPELSDLQEEESA